MMKCSHLMVGRSSWQRHSWKRDTTWSWGHRRQGMLPPSLPRYPHVRQSRLVTQATTEKEVLLATRQLNFSISLECIDESNELVDISVTLVDEEILSLLLD